MTLQKGHKTALFKKGYGWYILIRYTAQFLYKRNKLKMLVLSAIVLVSIRRGGAGMGGGG